MKLLKTMAVLCGVLTLPACASLSPPATIHQLQASGSYWIDTDASRRGIDIMPRADGKGSYICAEPSPDVAVSMTEQLLAQAQINTGKVQVDPTVQLQFNQAVVQLAQRSSTLMFLREAMYRICEQSANQTLTPDQVFQLDQIAMQTALKLSEADLAKNQADLAKTLANPQMQKLWDQVVNTPVAQKK